MSLATTIVTLIWLIVPFPVVSVSLTDFLSTSGGVKVVGAVGSKAGAAVSMIGDYNKDGKQDFAISAPLMTVNSKTECGMVLIVLGKDGTWSEIDLSTAASGLLMQRVIGAAADDNAGTSVGPAGDVNGDGVDDILIGAPYADPNSKSNSGLLYILFGKVTTKAYTDINLANFVTSASTGFTVAGSGVNSRLGVSATNVLRLGDVTGDKIDDFLVYMDSNGGSGGVWVLFGKKTTFSNINLASPGSAGVFLRGTVSNFMFGWTLDGVGDFNGDGINDLLIGERQHASDSLDFRGAAYLLYGSSSLATLSMSSFTTGVNGIRFLGVAAEELAGNWVSGAGDINGDGKADILISGSADLPLRGGVGIIYVIYGTSTQFSADISLGTLLAANLGFAIYGAVDYNYIGEKMSRSGDLDQDGFNDFVIVSRSSVYVLYGSAAPPTDDIDLKCYTGKVATFSGIGSSSPISGGVDVTGDGIPDLLVGFPFINNKAGYAYMLKGPIYPPTPAPSIVFNCVSRPVPSASPSATPTTLVIQPSETPSAVPSVDPSAAPSAPSVMPSEAPSADPSASPSTVPSAQPSMEPSPGPSMDPSAAPSAPSVMPSEVPSADPSASPSEVPSVVPSAAPSADPSALPSEVPSVQPSVQPSPGPSVTPSAEPSAPSVTPSEAPSADPSVTPSESPSVVPTVVPTAVPSSAPSKQPSVLPSLSPSFTPTIVPSQYPTVTPTVVPSVAPSAVPSIISSVSPSAVPSVIPTVVPSVSPTAAPTPSPTLIPTGSPTVAPSVRPSAEPQQVVLDVQQVRLLMNMTSRFHCSQFIFAKNIS